MTGKKGHVVLGKARLCNGANGGKLERLAEVCVRFSRTDGVSGVALFNQTGTVFMDSLLRRSTFCLVLCLQEEFESYDPSTRVFL